MSGLAGQGNAAEDLLSEYLCQIDDRVIAVAVGCFVRAMGRENNVYGSFQPRTEKCKTEGERSSRGTRQGQACTLYFTFFRLSCLTSDSTVSRTSRRSAKRRWIATIPEELIP